MSAFMKVCRACNSEKTNLLNLFASDCDDDEPTLGEKFFSCTALELEEDDVYPQNICYSCAKQLETAFKFRKQCERSYNQFKKKVASVQKESTGMDIKIETTVVDDEEPLEVSMNDACENTHEEDKDANYKSDLPSFQEENNEEDFDQNVPVSSEIADNTAEQEEAFNEYPEEGNLLVDFAISIQDRPHKCIVCGKSFFTIKALELHTRLNHKAKEVSINSLSNYSEQNKNLCTICNMKFSSAHEMKMHRIVDHGEKTLECNICGKHIRNRIAYKKHLLAHKNTRPHICTVCGKQYTEYRYLQRHMLYHMGAVYKCIYPNCGKAFSVKHKLIEHMRLHHNHDI